MTRFKSLLTALAITTGLLGVFLIAAVLIFPSVFNTDAFKEKIARELCRSVHCEIAYERLDVSFFPTPRARIINGSLDTQDDVALTWDQMTVIPRLRSLFRGQVELAKVICHKPVLQLTHDMPRESQSPDAAGTSSLDPQDWPAALLASMPRPSFTCEVLVHDGTVKLTGKDGHPFRLSHIQLHLDLTPFGYDMDLKSHSSLAQKVSLRGFVAPGSRDFHLSLGLDQARPQVVRNLFFPHVPLNFGDHRVNLELDLKSEAGEAIRGTIKGFSHELKVVKGDKEHAFGNGNFEARIHLTPARMEIILDMLRLEAPRSSFEGTFTWDTAQKESTLDIRGMQLDAAPVRDAALFIWEGHPVVSRIFQIVLAGDVPLITFHSRADHPAHLGRTENFLLEGEMRHGTVLVPNAEILVNKAFGKVTVDDGILECRDLRGATEGSTGENGHLVITLKRDPEPFHFQMDLDADLSELPPVLRRVVQHEGFQRELALFEDVKGRARGKLTLGESLKHVETRVELHAYQVASHYGRLPFPFTAEGERFLLEGESVSMDVSSGAMGRTSLSKGSAHVTWHGESHLQLTLGEPSAISLDDLYPWLLSHDVVKRHMTEFRSFKGTLNVHSLTFQGPAAKPEEWKFEMEGEGNSFAMDSTFLPSVLTVSRGFFKADHKELHVRDCQSRLLDASAKMNGRFHDYTRGLTAMELQIGGSFGQKANHYVMELAELPDELRVSGPYTVERSRVFWNRKQIVKLDGDVSWNGGVRLSLGFDKNGEQLSVQKLSIKDERSDATASFVLGEHGFTLDFKGLLQHSTLNRVLVKNRLLEGSIEGAVTGAVDLDHPLRTTLSGNLHLTGFQYIWNLESPARIEKADVAAMGNRLEFTETLVRWQDNHFQLRGSVTLDKPHLKVDLDMKAGSIDWNRVIDFVREKDLASQADGHMKVKDSTVVGIVRLKADELTRDSFHLSPLAADIHLEPDGVRLEVKDAGLCGLSTQGTVNPARNRYSLRLQVNATHADLARTVECLWKKEDLITGRFDLKGELEATSPPEELVGSLVGKLDFKARDGRINRFTLLSRIFSVINITEFYRGHFPNLTKEGLAYSTLEGTLHLNGQTVTVDEFILDGPYVKMVVKGDVDMEAQKVHLTVLISPLRTADRIIDMVPVLGNIMGGALIFIPVSVEGDMDNPSIVPLAPSAVGREILGYIQRVFKLPLRLIQPGS